MRQVLFTCTNSSACRSFVHVHMSVHTDVMSFRSASASMFLCNRVGLCSKFQFNAMVIGFGRIVEMNITIANDDSRNNADGCYDE